jgi:hypothetical protein
VPRRYSDDEDMPRQRRRAGAVAVEAHTERGLASRILLRSPKDLIAGALAFAAVSAIVANALFLQAGRHPSPMFGTAVASPPAVLIASNPLPRPRPAEASVFLADPTEPRADPLASLVKATGTVPAVTSSVPRPPAPISVYPHGDAVTNLGAGSRRVAAVQRALTDYGYGQLKPTGTIGSDTQAAIQKFERARRLPVTGQMSDRLVRELVAVVGHPID